MTERPIIFSSPMVRAILSGAKTQTRRVLKPQPPAEIAGLNVPAMLRDADFRCPYGDPGDRLYVKEQHEFVLSGPYNVLHVLYKADMTERDMFDAPYTPKINRGRPSIHMPRWVARLTLEVLKVRVERVQEISLYDVQQEGINVGPLSLTGARYQYSLLWDSINAKRGYGWETNPWVHVVTFKRVT